MTVEQAADCVFSAIPRRRNRLRTPPPPPMVMWGWATQARSNRPQPSRGELTGQRLPRSSSKTGHGKDGST